VWLLPLTLFCVALRAWMLLGQMVIAKHVRAATVIQPSNGLGSAHRHVLTSIRTTLPFFVRHRQWVRPQALFKGTLAIAVILFLILFLTAAAVPRYLFTACPPKEARDTDHELDLLFTMAGSYPLVYGIIAVGSMLVVARQLRRQDGRDAFGISTELRTIAIGWTLLTL
jgi:hypothetical protein